ncbi:phage protein NinX family protein [Citrobacter freundii]
MDYSKLSDFEINRRVFEAKSGLQTLGYPHNSDKRSCGHKDINGNYQWFDFCNNAADAWQIISGNKISTMWMTDEKEWCAWAQGDLEEGTWCWENVPDYYFCCESQLRAAAIVFLMMQEKGKDAGAAK